MNDVVCQMVFRSRSALEPVSLNLDDNHTQTRWLFVSFACRGEVQSSSNAFVVNAS